MIGEEEARAQILAAVAPLPGMKMPLGEARDLFAAERVRAKQALPGFDNSAMDGYAVQASSAGAGARLRVIGVQAAGENVSLHVGAGEAARVFTGAPIPEGADAVVMQEETEAEGDTVLIRAEDVALGDFIRKRGGDLAVGQQILEPGEQLTPAMLALMASQGLSEIETFRQPRVALVTTGDEAIAPGQQLRAGQIFESNGVMLAALAGSAGARVVMQEHGRDEHDELCNAFRQAVAGADALIVSGGVSVGERDLVAKALSTIGAELQLWRVKVKPGKPFLFGQAGACRIFGLPGNPVSSFLTFLIFVRPALRKMLGARELVLPAVRAKVAVDLQGDLSRPHYLRGQLQDDCFTPAGLQESHALFALARANALLRLAAGESVKAGELREVLPFA